MSLEPDSALPFESDHAATARTQPLHETAGVPQSTSSARDSERGDVDNDVDALSLFSPDPSPRQVPEDTVSHLDTTPAASAAAAIFRKLFPSHRAASLPSNDEVQASRDDLNELLDARAQIAEELTRCEARCRETETRNERAANAIDEIEKRLSGLDDVRDLAETMDGRLNTLRLVSEEARIRTDDLKAQGETIAHQLLAADDVTTVLTTLDARLADVTEKDQRLLEFEQMVAHLERRAADTSANLERQLGEFETRKHVIEQATSEATRVTGLLSALETRLTRLTSPEHELGRAERTLDEVERRATDASERLTRRVGDFEAQEEVIEQSLRVKTEQMVVHVERRAVDTSVNLERQLGEFERRKHVIEQGVAALEQRALQATNDVEQLTSGLDTRKDIIGQTASEATRVTGLLSALETRLARLTSPEHGLGRAEKTLDEIERRATDASERLTQRVGDFEAQEEGVERNLRVKAEQMVAQVERRAADTSVNLERQLGEFETRKHVIEQAVAALEQRATDASERLTRRVGDFESQEEVIERTLREARQIIEVLSGLEMRIVNLTGSDQILDRADMYVGGLERRAAAAVLQLEETTTLKNRVDQELAQLLQHLEDLTETARHQTGKRADGWKETCRRRVRRVRAAFGPAVAARWRTVLDWWSRIPRREALVRALAIAVLLGVGATSLVRPFASILRSVGRSSSTPVLLSRPLPEVMFAAQTPPSGVVGRIARDVLRSSPTLEASEDLADGKPPAKRSAGAVFIGALTIESQPPGATVFVDQQPRGKTPVHLASLRAGEHLVRVEHEGFEPWTASVRVPADRQTRVSPTLQADSPR